GHYAAAFAGEKGAAKVDPDELEQAARNALQPFEHSVASGEGPYQIQHELQEMMQDLVGIVRKEDEMRRALEGIAALRERARRVGVAGNREYNPGWHTALDLESLLTVSEAITRAAIERKESRGAQFREDCPKKDEACAKFNIIIQKGPRGDMQVGRLPIPEMPAELKQIIEEMG